MEHSCFGDKRHKTDKSSDGSDRSNKLNSKLITSGPHHNCISFNGSLLGCKGNGNGYFPSWFQELQSVWVELGTPRTNVLQHTWIAQGTRREGNICSVRFSRTRSFKSAYIVGSFHYYLHLQLEMVVFANSLSCWINSKAIRMPISGKTDEIIMLLL